MARPRSDPYKRDAPFFLSPCTSLIFYSSSHVLKHTNMATPAEPTSTTSAPPATPVNGIKTFLTMSNDEKVQCISDFCDLVYAHFPDRPEVETHIMLLCYMYPSVFSPTHMLPTHTCPNLPLATARTTSRLCHTSSASSETSPRSSARTTSSYPPTTASSSSHFPTSLPKPESRS